MAAGRDVAAAALVRARERARRRARRVFPRADRRDAGDLDGPSRAWNAPSWAGSALRSSRSVGSSATAATRSRAPTCAGPSSWATRAILSLGILERAAGNIEEARELYRRAADEGSAGGAYNLGLLEEREGNLAEALRWHVRRPRPGTSTRWAGPATCRAQRRHEAALRWWRLAAEQGDAKSAGQLAVLSDDYARHLPPEQRRAARPARPIVGLVRGASSTAYQANGPGAFG